MPVNWWENFPPPPPPDGKPFFPWWDGEHGHWLPVPEGLLPAGGTNGQAVAIQPQAVCAMAPIEPPALRTTPPVMRGTRHATKPKGKSPRKRG